MRPPQHESAAAPLIAALLTGALLLTGCSTDSGDKDTEPSRDVGSTGAFPATVAGVYGDVTIKERPQRVVALTAQSAEILIALGVKPIAVGATEDIAVTRPWLIDKVKNVYDTKLVENREINLEKVASYRPDLIVGFSSLFKGDVYRQSQEIATTFAGLAEGNPLPSWDSTTRALATLTGSDAKPVISGVGESCAAARAEVPQWAGKTYQWVAATGAQLTFGNGAALECFGLVAAANQDNSLSGAGISYENLDGLDAAFVSIVTLPELRSRVEADPRYASRPSVMAGAVIWLEYEEPTAHSINVAGPLSFDYLIKAVLPTLKATTPSS